MHKLDVSIISLSLQGVSKIILLLLEHTLGSVHKTVSSLLGQDSTEVTLNHYKVQILQT